MKAASLQSYGDTDQFRVIDLPIPTPGANEVLIRIQASTVNHIDLFMRQGFVAQYFPVEFPAVLGGDGAGIVEAVGEDVREFTPGDKVMAYFPLNGHGSQAEYAVVDVSCVAKLGDDVDLLKAATLPFVGLTGRQAVDVLQLKGGERVLVAGAMSAVGRAALQYVRELGAIAVAGVLPAELDEAKGLADEVLDITLKPEGPSFNYAVVTVGQAAANAIESVTDGGVIGSTVPAPDSGHDRLTFTTIMNRPDRQQLEAIAAAAARGELDIPIAKTFSLEQLPQAHAALAGGVKGKVVISIHG